MDDRTLNDLSPDETLEADLDAALRVDPSPAFVASVRGRVRQEAASRQMRPRGFTLLLGAAAVAVLLIGVSVLWPWSGTPVAPANVVAESTPLPVPAAARPTRATSGAIALEPAAVQAIAITPVPPRVMSGEDFGFRVEGLRGNTPVGQVVVRVNGEWVNVEVGTGPTTRR